MGQCKPPSPVKLIVGMLSRTEDLFILAQQEMQEIWGPVDIHSIIMPFDQTNYYEKEMGAGLLRKFVSFAGLIDPGDLPSIKHKTNELENSITELCPAGNLSGHRLINLDPGYIDLSKLVLATTKNYSHRVYIGNNMYAEATLHYHKGTWQPWPYTYPDYADGEYMPFFTEVRKKLAEQLSSKK